MEQSFLDTLVLYQDPGKNLNQGFGGSMVTSKHVGDLWSLVRRP